MAIGISDIYNSKNYDLSMHGWAVYGKRERCLKGTALPDYGEILKDQDILKLTVDKEKGSVFYEHNGKP